MRNRKHIIILIFFLTLFLHSCISMAPVRKEHDSYGEVSLDKFNFKIVELASDFSLLDTDKTIYLFATWCAPCLAEIKYQDRYTSHNTIFISTNYNIKSVADKLAEKTDTLFILSNEFYGSKENEKIKKFVSALQIKEDSMTGLPQRFEFKNGIFQRIPLE